MNEEVRIVRAKWVFPVAGEPIPNGCIELHPDGYSVCRDPEGDVHDLGNVALIPGLVNSHTHLEFSDLETPLGEPGTPFPDWIRQVVATRRAQAREAGDKHAAIQTGLEELQSKGTTIVGEIATLPAEAAWYQHQVTSRLFVERLSLDPEKAATLVDDMSSLLNDADEVSQPVGVSPHAPFTVHPDLLEKLCQVSAQQELPLAMHLAESLEEIELLRSGSGPMVQMMEDFHAWNPAAIPRGIAPYDYLERLSDAHHALVIHGNFLDTDDLEFLSEHRDNMTLVYCPRTHNFFKHGSYPLVEAIDLDVRVALGTDSRASNPDLDVFEELKFVAAHYPELDPAEVLRMATSSGAKALGLRATRPTVIHLPDSPPADPYEALFSGCAIDPM